MKSTIKKWASSLMAIVMLTSMIAMPLGTFTSYANPSSPAKLHIAMVYGGNIDEKGATATAVPDSNS